ncbi:hypothetical protein J5N97_016637 [Dioscorea zingiberensis]|uniref:Uncharacterized protein n=1 Tax=Dioscorea zingiberensis TaxID=325984 RepID=A0A9D5HFV1_9LILI|nr:hypothetical protein J5N97_016637 [Dioscorea zingiberensis]
MAKSLRSKKKKRLRTLRREIAEPFYENKDSAKLAAQEAALAAPKLPVRIRNEETSPPPAASGPTSMDVEMADGGSQNEDTKSFLKPAGGIGKKSKRKLKLKKGNRRGKGRGKFNKKRT